MTKKLSKQLRSALYAVMQTDGYKLDHRRQYPEGTTRVYANWTARGSRIPEIPDVVFVGLQALVQRRLMEDFEEFFAADVDEICEAYQNMLDTYLGPNDIGTDHIRALHDLGYLPLEIKALPEGTRVPLRVPMFTVENTVDEFFWLTNYVETIISSEAWLPMTDSGLKRSLKGRIAVARDPRTGDLIALDDSKAWQREDILINYPDENLLQTVWKDGEFVRYMGFDEVRANTGLV